MKKPPENAIQVGCQIFHQKEEKRTEMIPETSYKIFCLYCGAEIFVPIDGWYCSSDCRKQYLSEVNSDDFSIALEMDTIL